MARDQDPQIQKRIQDLQENLEDIKKENFRISDVNVDFIKNELLVPDFMKENTEFDTFNEMLRLSPFKIENDLEFEIAIETDKWDHYVAMNTNFYGWIEMLKAAVLDRAFRQMEL